MPVRETIHSSDVSRYDEKYALSSTSSGTQCATEVIAARSFRSLFNSATNNKTLQQLSGSRYLLYRFRDPFDNILRDHLFGLPDHILDRLRRRATMSDDRYAADSEQWHTAVLLIIKIFQRLPQDRSRDASFDLIQKPFCRIILDPR